MTTALGVYGLFSNNYIQLGVLEDFPQTITMLLNIITHF